MWPEDRGPSPCDTAADRAWTLGINIWDGVNTDRGSDYDADSHVCCAA
ncbi:hypothetical protein J2S46_000278 [Kitasatospora herbaricolor]|nr:hypothetical protein [Kitasatospora herbaricolor]MDQ0305722.1 hypothetical protein [Kitasatospora herbaricolor]